MARLAPLGLSRVYETQLLAAAMKQKMIGPFNIDSAEGRELERVVGRSRDHETTKHASTQGRAVVLYEKFLESRGVPVVCCTASQVDSVFNNGDSQLWLLLPPLNAVDAADAIDAFMNVTSPLLRSSIALSNQVPSVLKRLSSATSATTLLCNDSPQTINKTARFMAGKSFVSILGKLTPRNMQRALLQMSMVPGVPIPQVIFATRTHKTNAYATAVAEARTELAGIIQESCQFNGLNNGVQLVSVGPCRMHQRADESKFESDLNVSIGVIMCPHLVHSSILSQVDRFWASPPEVIAEGISFEEVDVDVLLLSPKLIDIDGETVWGSTLQLLRFSSTFAKFRCFPCSFAELMPLEIQACAHTAITNLLERSETEQNAFVAAPKAPAEPTTRVNDSKLNHIEQCLTIGDLVAIEPIEKTRRLLSTIAGLTGIDTPIDECINELHRIGRLDNEIAFERRKRNAAIEFAVSSRKRR